MYFSPDGLALGAGTILLPVVRPRRLVDLQGEEARLLALLAATYGKAISPSVLDNIEEAARSWHEGDDLAAVSHLAHAGLPLPVDPAEEARRLFLTDAFIRAGMHPLAILQTLGLDAAYVETVEKLYNELEPRVPAGNGIFSGRWTKLLSFLGGLPAAQAEQLGVWALGQLGLNAAAGAVAAAGLLVFPSPNRIRVKDDIEGLPGGRYSWNRDETEIHITYRDAYGEERAITAQRKGQQFLDSRGRVVGRVLPGDAVAIDTRFLPNLPSKDDEPKLCPAPGLDKPSGAKGRAYEDFVKGFVNPPPYTTPTGIGFQLANPELGGKPVYYDDCQHATGMMVEAKGPGYAKLLTFTWGKESLAEQWLDQSARQLAAAGSRRVRWYFAEPGAAEFARELFSNDRSGRGRGRIEIVVLPYPRSDQ
jgi:hypothetical protein